jgi:hypothetical protein
MKRFLDTLLFAPASRRSLVATRVIVAACTLWLVLSRPMLWAVAGWPRQMYPLQHKPFLLRFGLLLVPARVEHALYLALPLLLIAVLFGFATRYAAIAASILLYHFAPFEEVFSGLHSNGVAGFAFPTLALIALAFAEYNDGDQSREYRWPIVFVQSLLAFQYLGGGLSKLRFTGIRWYRGENILLTMKEMATLTTASWADAAASSLVIAWTITIATMALEFLFPLAVVSRRARWILVPAAAVAVFLRAKIYGFNTLSAPLLLLFVNWDWVLDHVTLRRTQPVTATE